MTTALNVNARAVVARFAACCLAGCAAVLLAGCDSHAEKTTAPPPPPLVDVVTLQAQPVTITTSLPGRAVAYRIAQVRPQVSGIILKRDYVEGSAVKAGQQLYQIDPAPYQAAYDSAKAALMNAEAALSLATLKVQRYAPLVKANAISKLDYATAQATEKQDRANVASAKAALETARINLRYTRVLSPIQGRSGRSLVTEGALVTGDQSSALTTIQQINPIYVDATQPSSTLLRLEREYAAGKLQRSGNHQAKVELTLGDGTSYAPAGKLQFSEVTVDPGTGSVTLRAVFPNPKHVLLPGMFVHLRIAEGVRQHALLVPQQGITHDPSGQATALIVDKDGKVQLRSVVANRAIGDKWLVTQGLKAGDRVIVKGLQFIKPGDKVRVEEARLGQPTQHTAANAAAG
ncbi:MAG: efflux RND transporter periplasmic adaptor subunit [Burkholderiales bacterium]